jgi:glutaredoxin
VTLITRAGCHLCQDAETVLRGLAAELRFGYDELDVDADPARRDEYSDRVPVILLDGREHGYWRVEEARLRKAVARWGRDPVSWPYSTAVRDLGKESRAAYRTRSQQSLYHTDVAVPTAGQQSRRSS